MGTDAAAGGRHVLVINDTTEILDAFRALLEDEGYRVSLDNFDALDLRKKVAEIEALRPDAIVLDFMFGAEPIGWQLLQLLRMRRATAQIPIVVCTAAATTAQELGPHLRTLGIEVVLKPFEIDAMLEAVARALQPQGRPDVPGTTTTPEG